MCPKKHAAKDFYLKTEMISLDMKNEIFERRNPGVKVADRCRTYLKSSSTLCTNLKQKDKILDVDLFDFGLLLT